jgi:hypothetical protein
VTGMSESNACASYHVASGCDFTAIIHSFIHSFIHSLSMDPYNVTVPNGYRNSQQTHRKISNLGVHK